MAMRLCTVTLKSASGVQHSAEVTAESVYEAAALGLSVLKRDGWVETIAPGAELEIRVREAATTHRVTVAQLQRWCNGVAVSPDETLKKRRLKAMIDETTLPRPPNSSAIRRRP